MIPQIVLFCHALKPQENHKNKLEYLSLNWTPAAPGIFAYPSNNTIVKRGYSGGGNCDGDVVVIVKR
jgi:hypothetical protein